MKWYLPFLLFLIHSVQAVDPYMIRKVGYLPVCDKSYVELNNLPPVRDQRQYGLCYAHSAMLLLDYLRCKGSSNPTACYADKGSVLHLSRYDNILTDERVNIGGDGGALLGRFIPIRKLSRESCASYDDWVKLGENHKHEIDALKVQGADNNEKDFFYFISGELKRKSDEVTIDCWANAIVNAGVNQNLKDVKDILSRANEMEWQELRYKILVPQQCLNSTLDYPEYRIAPYPLHSGRPKTFEGFRDHVYRSLQAGYPVEASFCAQMQPSGNCGFHSSTIIGQRHICNERRCSLQFRIQNSYGASWQESFDNGWVDAENLSNLMMDDPTAGLNTILPKGTSLDSKIKSPFYETHSATFSLQRSLESQGKVNLNSGERCWSEMPVPNNIPQSPQSPPVNPETDTEQPPRKVIYMCRGPNGPVFADKPIDGLDCKER